MTTKLIVGGRQSGRTTELIKMAAEAEANGAVSYIVCHSHNEAYRISQEARRMGLRIGFPITYDEFLIGSHSRFIKKFYIDNVEMLLQRLAGHVEVDAITLLDERG
jgi:hypothetical protein